MSDLSNSRVPNPKVVAGGAAGALSIVLVYVLESLGVRVPNEVAQAVTVLLSFAGGYLKRVA